MDSWEDLGELPTIRRPATDQNWETVSKTQKQEGSKKSANFSCLDSGFFSYPTPKKMYENYVNKSRIIHFSLPQGEEAFGNFYLENAKMALRSSSRKYKMMLRVVWSQQKITKNTVICATEIPRT